jgi:ABC-2 type transport system ATP-binding protein
LLQTNSVLITYLSDIVTEVVMKLVIRRVNMITLESVSKSYNGTIKAVDNISLEIKDGEIFGFLGPNGAGKTTTIKMITGILDADSGNIGINSLDIKKNALEAKKQFGFVPDDPNIFLRLKGIEYLNFIADIYDVSAGDRKQRIEEYAQRFEMERALGDKIQSYSHGMRQKIVLMGVMIHKPPVWILDEPMTGLDPKSSFALKEMMREHADNNKTVFFSTHILEVAEKICDRVAIINKGRILFCGRLDTMKEQFKGDESLEKMFLELTENEK